MSVQDSMPCTFRNIAAFVAVMICVGEVFSAPPKCDSLFPAGGQRGQEVSVTAAGSFSNWPVGAWVDREGIEVVPESDKGKLKVNISDSANGIYLIRLHDKEGASQLRPFIVDSLPEITETEPNNELTAANEITQSTIVNGRLEKGGEIDGFSIKLKAGQTLVASMIANQTLGSPMDGVLQICSERGFVVAQNDDERSVDPMIVYTAPSDGTYVIRTFAFPLTPNSTIGFSGSSTYIYRLTLTMDGFVDHVLPLSRADADSANAVAYGWNLPTDTAIKAPSDSSLDRWFLSQSNSASFGQQTKSIHSVSVASNESSRDKPQSIDWPTVISGRINEQGDEDVFQIAATKGTKLTVQVESDALGYRLDPLVQLLDADGKVQAEIDDTNRKRDCLLSKTIPADGDYRIVIRDVHRHGGLRYVYQATITEAKPDFALTLANDSFVVTPGKPLEIPVTIDRQNGFADVIEIQAINLPNGVRCDVVKSEAKGDSSKSMKLVVNADASGASGTFRVVGKTTTDNPIERSAHYVVSGVNARLHTPWVTVAAGSGDK